MMTAINGDEMNEIRYVGADAPVCDSLYSDIRLQSEKVIEELIRESGIKKGQILVIGCSSSEILGSKIGKGSSFKAASAVFESILPILEKNGIRLAAQCCEHLNRALVVEEKTANDYGLEVVCAVPKPKAGGSFATLAYMNMNSPVLVESIKAHAGLDIGGTLIGMHLRSVAVPVRLSISKIGEANIICARTRPKYIGGERTEYC